MTISQPANYSTFAYAYHGEVIAAGAIFPAVAIIVVGLRFWTRRIKKVALGADDWLIVPALVCKTHRCMKAWQQVVIEDSWAS